MSRESAPSAANLDSPVTDDSVKLANFLMPPSSGPRGWKNSSKNDAKEKHGADSKPKTSKYGKSACVLFWVE